MNYRHSFHAGNAVDVAKHVALVALLQALQRKPAPYAYLETHAGRGRYALDAEAASRTGEAAHGIQRMRAQRGAIDPLPESVARYLALVDDENPGVAPAAPARRYPGSPALAAAMARDGDRAVLCESDAEEAAALEQAVRHHARVEVRCADGWKALPGLVPPPERRGVVLIDPPFEQPEDWKRTADALLATLARWPSGTVAVWYPLKATAEAAGLEHRVQAAAATKVLRVNFRLRSDGPGLLGCGLLIANPPYGLGARLERELGAVGRALAGERGRTAVDWLVPED